MSDNTRKRIFDDKKKRLITGSIYKYGVTKCQKKKCFVIMPFSETESCSEAEWTEVFEDVIKPAVLQSGLGYDCFRAKVRRGAIIDQIIEHIDQSDVVVADLTDRNPNVFYELGVRHSLHAGCILIAQCISDVPFDLQSYGVLEYSRNPSGVTALKKEMRQLLKEIEKSPDKPDGPVMSYLQYKEKRLMSNKEIQSRIDERVSTGLNRLEELFIQTRDQLKDMTGNSHKVSNFGHQDLTGTYEGLTGYLKLYQREDQVSGTYQFSSEEYVGDLHGFVEDQTLYFNYKWKNRLRSGCGLAHIRSEGYQLDGYYCENISLEAIDKEDIEISGEPWCFSKISPY